VRNLGRIADGGGPRFSKAVETTRACGALGGFEIGRASKIAAELGRDISLAHRDESSVLFCDGTPARWETGSRSGWIWGEGPPSDRPVRSWKEAAREAGGCGLVRDGSARYLHSSVAGLAPVYFLEHGDATYFATRIDPLLAALPGRRRLSIDWRAWAAIFLVTAPLAERTPFLEVSRLPPFSRLDHRPGRGPRVRAGEWPWAAEPERGGRAEDVLDALREAMPASGSGPVSCPLSGGWDSRLLLMLARERGLPATAMTLGASQWRAGQERHAAAVARAAGVELDLIPAGRSYWGDQEATALLTDHQTTHHAWLLPLARRLARRRRPALDGIAGGILLKGHFVDADALAAGSRTESLALLWEQLSNERKVNAVLPGRLGAALTEIARRDWMREAEAFGEHPAALTLAAYRTRTVRAISLSPMCLLGAGASVLTPFGDDRVARAALAVEPEAKLDGALYRRVLELVDPRIGALPSSNDAGGRRPGAAKRPPSRRTLEGYRERLRETPLREEIDPRLLEPGAGALEHELGSTRGAHLVRALALLSIWRRRYSGRLREIDPAEPLG
jgi:Asparagine synthase